ncbi:MAG: hypothetical protein FWH55_13930 [Oscillospiraceae bacterium]|nr:hypothetical protein [Oscillospiraceae bacterium]
MRAVGGYLENGRFVPNEGITLPVKSAAILIIHEAWPSSEKDDEKVFWAEFDQMTAASSSENELLSDEAFFR